MRYVSVCSGIEAASAAWCPLGWEPLWFSEIEPFACKLLAARYPDVPNLGDLKRIADAPPLSPIPDLVVGGTPCQSFSFAGLRLGLADPRGGLLLDFLRVVRALRPQWVVWENVPGVLSVDGGRAFGSLLGGLGELGYQYAYRVLDAQYFGVPQRRRRVFVVGSLGARYHGSGAVLFEPESGGGHLASGGAAAGANPRTFGTLLASFGKHYGQDNQHVDGGGQCFVYPSDSPAVRGIRRPTPLECERLQGFPDGYTGVGPESARISALGNSIAVPVLRWIGERINKVRAERARREVAWSNS